MTGASFVNPAAAKRKFGYRKPPAPKAAGAVLPHEVYDALESAVVTTDRDAKKMYGGHVEVRFALLEYLNSAEFVVIVKSSAKASQQLHYFVGGGALVFVKDGELEIADAGSIEGLADFLPVLRADVASILADAKFNAALTALPVRHAAN